ncbi:hypothetical protein [Streptomyces zhaozhouensis]|nr:hypothetical protein [Streptomyces zhaozhouensis]
MTHPDAADLAAAGGLSIRAAESAMASLRDRRLVEWVGDDPAGVRPADTQVLRHAQMTSGTDAERTAMTRRWVESLLATASEAEAALVPYRRRLRREYTLAHLEHVPWRDTAGAVAWVRRRADTLLTAANVAHLRGWWGTSWQVVDSLWPALVWLCPAPVWDAHRTVGVSAAQQDGHEPAVRRMLVVGASGYRQEGALVRAGAWCRQALESARADQEPLDVADALYGLAAIQHVEGHLSQARALLHQAMRLRDDEGYQRGVALIKVRLGLVEVEAGRWDHGVHLLAAARETLRAESAHDAARALAAIGRAHVHAGHPDRGLGLLLDAHEEFTRLGSPPWQARCLEWAGRAMLLVGRGEEGLDHLQLAVAGYRAVGSVQDVRRVEAAYGQLDRPEGTR